MKFLTKGDNNQVDDRGLYAPGQLWLEKKDVVGRAKGSVCFRTLNLKRLCWAYCFSLTCFIFCSFETYFDV